MIAPPLACTVRDCGLLLERHDRAMRCARGHSYDIARSGYVALLQPQDRKSLDAGDSRAAVDARARLIAAGVGRVVVEGIADRAARVLEGEAVAIDLGSGTGDLLATVVSRVRAVAVGIDLSVAAAEHAARRFPAHTWVVANADRRLPLLDRSVDLVLSVHGRRNPAECARVLTRGGHLLLAVPAADDLIELRTALQGEGVLRARADPAVSAHAEAFVEVDRAILRERHRLERDALADLLRGTYRGERRSMAERLRGTDALEVTLASEVVLLERK